jgi:biotin carboxyl carrier protein
MSIEKNIIRLFEEIESSKNSIKEVSLINEVAFISPVDNTSVTSPFGPRFGRQHTGVDLTANSTNVKAPADGIVEVAAILNDDCGGTIKINHAGGFKSGYCHMKKINVAPGQQVKQGDIIGISGGGANDVGRGRSDGPHLHFTLRKDDQLVNPMDYINKSGINLTGPVTNSVSKTNSSSSTLSSSTPNVNSVGASGPTEYAPIVGTVKSIEGLYENRNFGKNTSDRYGRIIIPKEDNPKIKSPISGKINNRKFFSGCVNQTTIEYDNNGTKYLQYCGISNPSLSTGDVVSAGSILGNTDSDVEVTLYDYNWSRIPITYENVKTIGKEVEKDSEKKDNV